MPDSFKILLSVTQNKWVIAKQDGYAVETVVWKIKYCPFCGEKLEEKQN
jgi:hypothetical protein